MELTNAMGVGESENGTELALPTGTGRVSLSVSHTTGLSSSEVLVSVSCASHVSVFESLLPYSVPTNDITWLRMPLLFVGLVVVFGWQFMRSRKGGGGGGGGGQDFSQFDMDELARSMGGGGMGMPGMGGGGGRGGSMGGMVSRMLSKLRAFGS